MKVYGVVGWKNAGKTTLMERLVAEITGRGLSVSTVKHVHHDVDLDQPGKDTFRHRAAGAQEVILASAHRFALMREHRGSEPPLAKVLTRLAPVDLVLVEGYKRDAHPKVEVFRHGEGRDLIQPGDPTVRAVATDAPLAGVAVPVLDLNDPVAVADFILRETGLSPAFDTVAIVDWSAASKPSPAKPSADAIWIGVAGGADGAVRADYLRTRAEAEAALVRLIEGEAAAGRRLLIGFDFPMAYPAGFARRLTGSDRPPAIWRWLADRITDEPDNANNRFAIAAEINRHLGAPVFWGRPGGLTLPDMPERKMADPTAIGLPIRRAAERLLPGTQPVWKTYTTGSVGGQALTGLPLIHRLSLRPDVAVWPFDASDTKPVVLAEVWPSILSTAVKARMTPDAIKDRVQVETLALALWRLDRFGGLGPLFDTPPEAAEEGWILGLGHRDALERALLR